MQAPGETAFTERPLRGVASAAEAKDYKLLFMEGPRFVKPKCKTLGLTVEFLNSRVSCGSIKRTQGSVKMKKFTFF